MTIANVLVGVVVQAKAGTAVHAKAKVMILLQILANQAVVAEVVVAVAEAAQGDTINLNANLHANLSRDL